MLRIRRMPAKTSSKPYFLTTLITAAVLCLSVWLLGRIRPKGRDETPTVIKDDATPMASSEEARRLLALYEGMAVEFEAKGLNTSVIEPILPWFHGVDAAEDTPWPKVYVDTGLQPDAVRLLVIPFDDAPFWQSVSSNITQQVLRQMPNGTKVFPNARANYHCTVFHTSQPYDPRPDPSREDGGTDLALPPGQRRSPSPVEMAREVELMRSVAAQTKPPVLQMDRLVMAPSGTLLLTWVDTSNTVQDLRQRCRKAFPGASVKQASIIHTSLLRVLSTQNLPPESISAITELCKQWTEKLRGKLFSPSHLWFIKESEFSTIEGERHVLPIAVQH